MERKTFEAEVKEFDEQDLTVTHFISTERLDRGNEILYASGMEMGGKPVVLLQHGWSNMGQEPVAKPVWIKPGEFKKRKGIQAKTQFYPDDLGKRLWDKTAHGYMPNWSVGWRPLEEESKSGKEGERIRHVYRWELLEYSLVGVPMQPDAQSLEKAETLGNLEFKIIGELEEKRGTLISWKNDKGEWEGKPYPNEHACRLEDPDKYIRIRRENDALGEGVHAIWGVQGGGKPVELQAIRFALAKFSASEARAWLKTHDRTCKIFEPATGKAEESCGCEENESKEGGKEKNLETASPDEKTKGTIENILALCDSIDNLNSMISDLRLEIDCINESLENLEKRFIALEGVAEPASTPVADAEENQGAQPPDLIFEEEKGPEDEEESTRLPDDFIKKVIQEVLGELAQKEIDRLKGKVK